MENNMTLATSDKELTFIYSSGSSIAKQSLAYVKSSELNSNLIDVSEAGLTGTQWSEVANLLGASLDELVAKDHPDVDSFAKDANLSDDHWIKFIQHNPNAIQQPILIKGKKAMQITTPSDVMKFISVDSAGLEKHRISEDPEIQRTTDGETQV